MPTENEMEGPSVAAETYNLVHYYPTMHDQLRRYFRAEPLRVGQRAPAFALRSVDGDLFESSALLAAGHVALIFGCYSAPPAVREVPMFRELYTRCPSRVRMLYVYTREIHPNEPGNPDRDGLPQHSSFDQKLRHAKSFRDDLEITFPVLVDDLEGSVHQSYGGLPHFQIVVRDDGVVVHRAEWASARQLEGVLQNLTEYDRQQEMGRARSSYSETIWFGERDRP